MITNIRIYDNPSHRSFSWSEVTTGELNGVQVSSAPNTVSAVPGSLSGEWDGEGEDTRTYVRTDTSGFPTEIQTLTAACWTEDSYTQHEAFLRA